MQTLEPCIRSTFVGATIHRLFNANPPADKGQAEASGGVWLGRWMRRSPRTSARLPSAGVAPWTLSGRDESGRSRRRAASERFRWQRRVHPESAKPRERAATLRIEDGAVTGGSVRLPGAVTKNKQPLPLVLTGQLLTLVARRWALRVPECPYSPT